MSGSSRYIKKALEEINENKQKQELIAKSKLDGLYIKYPYLNEINRSIAQVFNKAMQEMLNSNENATQTSKQISLQLQEEKRKFFKDNGIDENDLKPKFSCFSCEDSGYFNGKICDCVRLKAAQLMYDELNSTVPLENSTFELFDLKYYPNVDTSKGNPSVVMGRILNICKKYADNFSLNSKSLLFFGKTGLGKTHLSLSIANEVIKKGYSVVYGPISTLINKIESEHFSRENKKETLSNIIDSDLLILDDLGCEFSTSFTISVMYEIINSRILNKKPTIINTNLTIDELEKMYQQRLVSRIYGSYKLFEFIGQDIRTLK